MPQVKGPLNEEPYLWFPPEVKTSSCKVDRKWSRDLRSFSPGGRYGRGEGTVGREVSPYSVGSRERLSRRLPGEYYRGLW